MTVHFICEGNTYRSRLAETYLNSLRIPEIKAISSGYNAEGWSGIISWLTQRIIQKNKLIAFEKPMWDRTTQELVDEGDYTVFMTKQIYDLARQDFKFDPDKTEVWQIEDVKVEMTDEEKIRESEETFETLKQKVDELVLKLSK